MKPKKSYPKIFDRRKRQLLNDGYSDLQWKKPMGNLIPTKAILLAVILFVFGSILLVFGSLLLTRMIDTKYPDRTWPLIIIGSLLFIPGAYHVNIAYHAYLGDEGYSYQDIPNFE